MFFMAEIQLVLPEALCDNKLEAQWLNHLFNNFFTAVIPALQLMQSSKYPTRKAAYLKSANLSENILSVYNQEKKKYCQKKIHVML